MGGVSSVDKRILAHLEICFKKLSQNKSHISL